MSSAAAGGATGGSGAPSVRLALDNPMSLLSEGRPNEISMEMSNADVIVMPDTRSRAAPDRDCKIMHRRAHTEYEWGWAEAITRIRHAESRSWSAAEPRDGKWLLSCLLLAL